MSYIVGYNKITIIIDVTLYRFTQTISLYIVVVISAVIIIIISV